VELEPFGIAEELLVPSWEEKCFCGSKKNKLLQVQGKLLSPATGFLGLYFVYKLIKIHFQFSTEFSDKTR
jgi:hypothetical protein